ncbi:putative glyoxylase family protein (Lactoylglutathione lyase) [Alkalibacterium sp. AK22]|nr:putative glyoxylase family protein (Lactoylglutathione lyase) [Alkalibacterium sp. AK22]
MKIEHIGFWVKDLERIKSFYETYFQAASGPLYCNSKNQFTSYFLTFNFGSQLERMHRDDIARKGQESLGYVHRASRPVMNKT